MLLTENTGKINVRKRRAYRDSAGLREEVGYEMLNTLYYTLYRVFIKYCVFFVRLENIPDSGLSLFSLCVSVCTPTRQVKHQRCSRTGRVQKNHKVLRKKHNI